ncbi:MAG TPA: sigma-70 family RNA polymerase sigma factor [Polyangiaceae bacterium]|nr:sigma-70 family RNA polymerase sigma factor [Polyangiaceae bacterium]
MDNLGEAVERVRAGDAAAFQRIVDATSARLVRLAARMLGNVTDAEDVVQEAYVKAHRALMTGEFDGRANVSTWLYRIVTNQSIDAMRSRKRRPQPTDTADESTSDLASAEQKLALTELEDWMSELPADQRAALVLKAVEGLTSPEIAEVLQCSEGAVEQRLVRARAALRKRSEGQ